MGSAADRTAFARREAANDRWRSSQDREAEAEERARAGRDRATAMTDRGAGARERFRAEADRNNASAVDRGASSLDEPTQVYRRGPGLLLLDRRLQEAQGGHESLIVAFIDVDGLEAVDDGEFHPAGDAVLRAVAEALRSTFRRSDLVTRYGDDELIVSRSGTPGAEGRCLLAFPENRGPAGSMTPSAA